ncbi:S8 family peptidase [Bryobacter aggregatus]|uniref:S8 family peptidase n=1 Tax=Bryobacter aggregatus TaxID=360054 RepID=UPI00068FA896|nr:S8 family peptidase [Bryobacter aggregatus]
MPNSKKPSITHQREQLNRDLMRAVITEPLLSNVKKETKKRHNIIVALNEQYPDGIDAAREQVLGVLRDFDPKANGSHPSYVFANLTGEQILQLAKDYAAYLTQANQRWASPIYRIWEDPAIHACVTKSIATVKADAAHQSFRALGGDITFAVLDSGIDGTHPHFKDVIGPVERKLSSDFLADRDHYTDEFGHGTHVAGIISGSYTPKEPEAVVAVESMVEGSDDTEVHLEKLTGISGIAPQTRLVSLKILDREGVGKTSEVLLAIEFIQKTNQYGRRLRIHGVNLSVGYEFNPRWFGCGQSPLCVEVNRLVKAGVVVVVAAGNSGFSALGLTTAGTNELGYRALSINDPGNAELAITVGATHRDMPHTYGVSFFSSRGPTGDGRCKPDLVAPGEKIVSCAAGSFREGYAAKLGKKQKVLYLDQSGTSMAAPHVSGAIAAFLSVRREFIGKPENVKELFLQTAVNLNRDRSFQGHGLLDLLKALQSI